MENKEALLEGILFAMGEPVENAALAAVLELTEEETEQKARTLQENLKRENRGIRLLRLENSWQLCAVEACHEPLIRLVKRPKKQVLSDVVMETLAIIAYKQPITKLEIEKIRGVSSDHAVNKLVEYGLICEAGRLNAPGRPMLFATTEEFLRRFRLENLNGLPIPNPEKLAEINQEIQKDLGETSQDQEPSKEKPQETEDKQQEREE